MTTEYEIHSLANIFPMITGKQFAELVEDIRVNGLHEKIILLDGKILDGRNRYKACLKAGVAPVFENYEGDNPLAYVLSANLRRRHLDESQRAMVAAKIATLQHGQRQTGKFAALPTQKQAAELLNVGERSVRTAKAVIDHGVAGLVDLAEKGEVRVSPAAEVAKLPEAEQVAIIEQGPEAVVKAASEVRKQVPVKESWPADVLRGANIHDSARSFVKEGLTAVVKADDGARDDIAADLGTALDFLEGVVGDVIEDFRDDEDLLAKAVEASFTKAANA